MDNYTGDRIGTAVNARPSANGLAMAATSVQPLDLLTRVTCLEKNFDAVNSEFLRRINELQDQVSALQQTVGIVPR